MHQDEFVRPPDRASDGRRALLAVSDQLQSVPFPDASASHLADVHLDWKAIKAAPGTADPRRLFPGDDGMVRDGHRGARAGERGAVAPDRPVEQAPSARPEPVH